MSKLKLIYEELFIYMFKINYLKQNNKKVLGIMKKIDKNYIEDFLCNLNFKLTVDQEKTIDDILNDMQSKRRMNRLVLGDVGSGKTIVAIIAMLANYTAGYQSAFMAPTEILAKQHFEVIQNYFENYSIKVKILTGSLSKKNKACAMNLSGTSAKGSGYRWKMQELMHITSWLRRGQHI